MIIHEINGLGNTQQVLTKTGEILQIVNNILSPQNTLEDNPQSNLSETELKRLSWQDLTWDAFQRLTNEEKRLFVNWFPNTEVSRRYKRNKVLKWVGVSVLGCGVIGGAYYFITKKND